MGKVNGTRNVYMALEYTDDNDTFIIGAFDALDKAVAALREAGYKSLCVGGDGMSYGHRYDECYGRMSASTRRLEVM